MHISGELLIYFYFLDSRTQPCTVLSCLTSLRIATLDEGNRSLEHFVMLHLVHWELDWPETQAFAPGHAFMLDASPQIGITTAHADLKRFRELPNLSSLALTNEALRQLILIMMATEDILLKLVKTACVAQERRLDKQFDTLEDRASGVNSAALIHARLLMFSYRSRHK